LSKMANLRLPVVAGTFYPQDAAKLSLQIEGFIDKKAKKTDCIACMLPHAGYIYSGRVAAQTLSRINIKNKVILFGPNHTGSGAPFSIQTKGVWQTPLGDLKVESKLANACLEHSDFLQADSEAHLEEHSLEVELPILQYFKKDFEIIPICLRLDGLSTLRDIGNAVAGAVKELKAQDSVLLVASSDMTHYEPAEEAARKDKQAIKAILELDEEKLTKEVMGLDISMCGYAPVSAMLAAAKTLGAKSAELVMYQTSGDVTGDKTSVVGYAGIIIK